MKNDSCAKKLNFSRVSSKTCYQDFFFNFLRLRSKRRNELRLISLCRSSRGERVGKNTTRHPFSLAMTCTRDLYERARAREREREGERARSLIKSNNWTRSGLEEPDITARAAIKGRARWWFSFNDRIERKTKR